MQTVETPDSDMATPRDSARQAPGWGVLASILAHALLAAVIIFGLPLPEMEKPEEQAVSVELVPPPEEEKQEEQAEEEPAQEEAAPPEEQKAEEKPPEPTAEETAAAQEKLRQQLQALRPVFQFGEKDSGPRETPDGGAATEPKPTETPPEEPLPPSPDGAIVVVPEEEPPLELDEARTLFSRSASRDIVAMTAIAGMPRGARAGELCASEMREQLRHASPPWRPELLPSYRIDTGTVMEVRSAAFRAGGQWYDLSFRCVIDGEATRVVSFAFKVGGAIPRSEWKSRGFPDN